MRKIQLADRIMKHAVRAEKTAEKGDINKDEILFNSVAMDCFQAVNYCIELGELVVEEKKLESPYSYREIFDAIFSAGLISIGMRNALTKLAYLRNIIAHQYGSVEPRHIKEMVHLMKYAKQFANKFRK